MPVLAVNAKDTGMGTCPCHGTSSNTHTYPTASAVPGRAARLVYSPETKPEVLARTQSAMAALNQAGL